MKWINAVTEDSVRILELNHGVTNALNGELLKELEDCLVEIRNDPESSALVLTSANGKFFSAGFDLPELYPQEVSGFKEFFHSFNRICLDLYTLPRPTVAALTGHAVAGGFILASCCDYRFMAQGKKLCGLNEIQIGVPVPYIADLILRQLVGDRAATEIMYTGTLVPAENALQIKIPGCLGLTRRTPQRSRFQSPHPWPSPPGSFPDHQNQSDGRNSRPGPAKTGGRRPDLFEDVV